MSQVRKGRIDPIEILREFITMKKNIKSKKDKKGNWVLVFDGNEFKFSMETAWKSVKTQKDYDLGSLWWFLESKQKKIESKEYRNKLIDFNIDAVMMVDQQEVEDYFTGKIDYSESINAEKKSKLYKQKMDMMEPALTKKLKSNNEDDIDRKKIDFNIRVIEEMFRFEKPVTTKNRQFRCYEKNFRNILQLSQQILYGQATSQQEQLTETVLQFNGSLLQEITNTKQKPIIIVPQIFEMGNLCLKNAQRFLQEGEYIDPTTVKFTSESRSLDIVKEVKYLKQNIQFEVRDTPSSFDLKTWKRVVAIFVRGSTYELKPFPDAKDTNYFFKRYRGYFLKFEDDKPKDIIKQWNVKVLELHRNKRHYDQSVVNAFWDDLENFILKPIYKEKSQ